MIPVGSVVQTTGGSIGVISAQFEGRYEVETTGDDPQYLTFAESDLTTLDEAHVEVEQFDNLTPKTRIEFSMMGERKYGTIMEHVKGNDGEINFYWVEGDDHSTYDVDLQDVRGIIDSAVITHGVIVDAEGYVLWPQPVEVE